MAGKRSHYWVYHRAVLWCRGKWEPEPETTPEIEYAPWWFVDDVWAKSAERAVEIVQERLRKEPGYPFNLAPDYAFWSSVFLEKACRVDWMCGPEPVLNEHLGVWVLPENGRTLAALGDESGGD